MKQGFSLVELSIVLVILGLLTGGILTGQNLIRAAELRAVTTEFSAYQTAVMTFKDKYFYLPADIVNATDFWGSAGGSGVIGDGCELASGTGTQTCNGDGNGDINSSATLNTYKERFTFWQHLANAGMIEGSYTGKTGPNQAAHHVAGETAPASRLGNAVWSAHHRSSSYSGNASSYRLDYGNLLFFGGGDSATEAVLTPEEAWNIDTKMDDGKPASGKIIAIHWDDACAAADDGTSANDDLQASYRLSDDSVQCALTFRQAF